MPKDKTAPFQRTKTADKTSKTLQDSGHREDIEAAPLRLTEAEIADRDYYRTLERLGAPSAYTVALAVFRTRSADSEHEPYPYEYLLAASEEPPVRHRESDGLQRWVEEVLADLDRQR